MIFVFILALFWCRFLCARKSANRSISRLPGPGNIQHLAYVVAKEKKFYHEMGLTNVNIVVLRGNAMNVQALMSGSVHYSSAFGPSMQAMFKGEQIRVLLQIFNQIPFGLITRPDIKAAGRSEGHKKSP